MVSLLKLRTVDAKVSEYFHSMVQDTVNYREKNNVKRNDFMQLLIQIKNRGKVEEEHGYLEQNGHGDLENKSDENGLSMNSLAAQAFVFFVAGFETSSTTMTLCLYELSLHQDIQERLREEIDIVLKKHDGKITYEAIQEMEYLDKVVSGKACTKFKYLNLLQRSLDHHKYTPFNYYPLQPNVSRSKTINLFPHRSIQFLLHWVFYVECCAAESVPSSGMSMVQTV
ncbi:hypothetical protein B7P43_G18276 [Cryptotermes secundus]|uniref:Cytochrome P450 6a14 n=2 Tax=Cryptotermes secundus TaxID=105785 RepID=A0A2J7R001_9NEOP|nr:hypothetical protein B7P43_G18276 [Cryptotermes secundus]